MVVKTAKQYRVTFGTRITITRSIARHELCCELGFFCNSLRNHHDSHVTPRNAYPDTPSFVLYARPPTCACITPCDNVTHLLVSVRCFWNCRNNWTNSFLLKITYKHCHFTGTSTTILTNETVWIVQHNIL